MTRFLVTGGAGFIGSHLVDALIAQGSRVVVVDDLSTGNERNINPGAAFVRGDITDPNVLSSIASDTPHFDGVFHLAAQTSVVASMRSPILDAVTNIASTLNVIEFSRISRAPVVFTSTGGAIYRDDAPVPTPVTSAIGPSSPYGASKASCEIYLQMAHEQSGLPTVIGRLSNVYGPRQRGDGEAGVVAIFASRIERGETCQLFGNGAPTRDYIHVSDVCSALISSLGQTATLNISTGQETTTSTVLELVATGLGQTSPKVDLQPLRDGEKRRSCLSPDLAREILDWNPGIDIRAGIPATARAIANKSASD